MNRKNNEVVRIQRARVQFTEMAFAKMMALVDYFNSEVGWIGTVERVGDTDFKIKDVFVYPQNVTGASITTDQGEYAMWYCQLPDAVLKDAHFHGHSHVWMGVSPSCTDRDDWNRDIEAQDGKGFRVFMIINKQGDEYMEIYDFDNSVVYRGKDIEFAVGDFGMKEFLDDAKRMVKAKPTKRYRIRKD